MKTLATIAAALSLIALPAAAQNAHAGHGAMQQPAQPSGVVTTPADGAMLSGTPDRFTATFPHPMQLKTVSIAPARGAAISVTVPAAAAAARASVALPRLAAGNYTLTWTAQGGNGHEMTGTVRFMVH
ncbi:MAG: copper resistance CopC family protein [Brevundimonas aurantiaca]|jgi:methionine-rich copper-binding protein CopC|uniref:copper resistance CopC family protein n=1 Tax=Brevundimonas aurantiaca TaxID=74316 RepID=UPI002FDCF296